MWLAWLGQSNGPSQAGPQQIQCFMKAQITLIYIVINFICENLQSGLIIIMYALTNLQVHDVFIKYDIIDFIIQFLSMEFMILGVQLEGESESYSNSYDI